MRPSITDPRHGRRGLPATGPSPVVLAAGVVLLACGTGCATLAPTVVPGRPAVHLEFAGAQDVDPAVAADCAQSLASALTRRGFAVGREGMLLRVHVAFWDHTSLSAAHEAQVAADFTGSSSGLPRGTTIVASATGSEATLVGGLQWPTARARIAACVYGSERFAESFAVTLNRVRPRL